MGGSVSSTSKTNTSGPCVSLRVPVTLESGIRVSLHTELRANPIEHRGRVETSSNQGPTTPSIDDLVDACRTRALFVLSNECFSISQIEVRRSRWRRASVERRALMSEYASSISLPSPAASLTTPGFSFTWRMYLPLPSSKPAGSGSDAP